MVLVEVEPQDVMRKEVRRKKASTRFIGWDYTASDSAGLDSCPDAFCQFVSFFIALSFLFDTITSMTATQPAFTVQNMDFYYNLTKKTLSNINLEIQPQKVTALIGPSGCGKSTFLRIFNRMNDLIDGVKISGDIFIDGNDIYDKKTNIDELRKNVGMVFQKPNPFPKTIFENIAYGLRVNGITNKKFIEEI